jgi:hypothetical protein
MKCESVREKLTAYLDGELEGERGSAIRGHLRGCEACRQTAADEAALRDGLRSLPPLDPPASLWAGVQARLAAEEVRDAERPTWRRALGWLRPRATHIGLAGAALATAIILLVMRMQRDDEPQVAVTPPAPQNVVFAPQPPPEPPKPGACDLTPSDDDVTASLAAEPARVTDCYVQTARGLLAAAENARAQWPAERQTEFDDELAELQHEVALATEERPRRAAYRKLIRYLRRAAIHDDVALAASGGTP